MSISSTLRSFPPCNAVTYFLFARHKRILWEPYVANVTVAKICLIWFLKKKKLTLIWISSSCYFYRGERIEKLIKIPISPHRELPHSSESHALMCFREGPICSNACRRAVQSILVLRIVSLLSLLSHEALNTWRKFRKFHDHLCLSI